MNDQFVKTLLFSLLFVVIIFIGTTFKAGFTNMGNPIIIALFVSLFVLMTFGTYFYQKFFLPKESLKSLKNIQKMSKEEYAYKRKLFLKKNPLFRYLLVAIIIIGLFGIYLLFVLGLKVGGILLFVDALVAAGMSNRLSRAITLEISDEQSVSDAAAKNR